jgi:hypothetical protein
MAFRSFPIRTLSGGRALIVLPQSQTGTIARLMARRHYDVGRRATRRQGLLNGSKVTWWCGLTVAPRQNALAHRSLLSCQWLLLPQ